jgi:hypothetical protein
LGAEDFQVSFAIPNGDYRIARALQHHLANFKSANFVIAYSTIWAHLGLEKFWQEIAARILQFGRLNSF